MIEKDDLRYFYEMYEKISPLLKGKYLHGGSNWRTKMRELGLIEMGQVEEVIHAINLNDGKVITKYAKDLPHILPHLSEGVFRNIGKKIPKNQIIVTNTMWYGELCGRFIGEEYIGDEIDFLLEKDVKECRYGMDGPINVFCMRETTNFGRCDIHLKLTLDIFRKGLGLFQVPFFKKSIKCLLEYKGDMTCNGKYEEGHGVCYDNSYLDCKKDVKCETESKEDYKIYYDNSYLGDKEDMKWNIECNEDYEISYHNRHS